MNSRLVFTLFPEAKKKTLSPQMKARYRQLMEKVKAYLKKEKAKNSFWSRFISERSFDPEYWQWHRRCISVGMGWGAFFAIAPVPMQSLWGALMCLWKRGNIPVAILCAWLSPPGSAMAVLPFQWYLGNKLFSLLGINVSGLSYAAVKEAAGTGTLKAFSALLSEVSFPLVAGELVLGALVSCSALGLLCYGLSQAAWQTGLLLKKRRLTRLRRKK